MTVHALTPVASDQVIDVDIDGWPALQIDPATGSIRVNDLRATEAYAVRADATEPAAVGHQIHIVIDPERRSLTIDTGSVVAWIDREHDRPTLALVRAVNDDCIALLDCVVRFRQEPAATSIRHSHPQR